VIDRIIRLSMMPIILIVVLVDQIAIDENLPNCLFKYFLGIECWGCGMTRAILELCKFNLQGALALNSLSPIVLILIFLIFCKEFFNKRYMKWLNLQ